MGGISSHPPLDRRLGALLRRQHGVVSKRQLRSLGFSDDTVDARVAKGVLVRVGWGVFAAGHAGLSERGRWMAAVLTCGDGAVLSHRSAAALWGLWKASALIDVTVPRSSGRASRGKLIVHRSRCLPYSDVTRRHGIPVTKPPRTLLDLAEVVDRRRLERALDDADRLGLCTESQLRAAVERHPGRVGAARLAEVLDAHDLGSTATANEFEELFLSICDAAGFPRPEVNRRLPPFKPDFMWRAHWLIVETDGYATHRTRGAFESDHERDTELGTSGWLVLRFTWRQLTERPDWVTRKVREGLSERRAARS